MQGNGLSFLPVSLAGASDPERASDDALTIGSAILGSRFRLRYRAVPARRGDLETDGCWNWRPTPRSDGTRLGTVLLGTIQRGSSGNDAEKEASHEPF
jgi:hypothetical protein